MRPTFVFMTESRLPEFLVDPDKVLDANPTSNRKCTQCAEKIVQLMNNEQRKRRWREEQCAFFRSAQLYLSAGYYCDLGEKNAESVGLPPRSTLEKAGGWEGFFDSPCSDKVWEGNWLDLMNKAYRRLYVSALNLRYTTKSNVVIDTKTTTVITGAQLRAPFDILASKNDSDAIVATITKAVMSETIRVGWRSFLIIYPEQ